MGGTLRVSSANPEGTPPSAPARAAERRGSRSDAERGNEDLELLLPRWGREDFLIFLRLSVRRNCGSIRPAPCGPAAAVRRCTHYYFIEETGMTTPMQNLVSALRRHGLVRFIEQLAAEFPTSHLKDVV